MKKRARCSRRRTSRQTTSTQQKPEEGHPDEQRQVMIGLGDAQALVLILKGWLPVLQKMAEHTPELDADVFSLRSLLLRLERFGEQDAEMELTYLDLATIDLSLQGFGELLRQKIPQSTYRDQVLQSIDWLYQQFAALHTTG
jgi:hypothetical protein